MIKKIGTKVYYCNITGNVIKVIYDMMGFVNETTFDEDFLIYSELNERNKESIGLILLEFGEYSKLSKDSTGVKVNLKTKELEFSYEPLPEIPQESNEIDIIKDKIDILNAQNANLLLDNAKKEIEINTLNKNLANVTLEVAKMKVGA